MSFHHGPVSVHREFLTVKFACDLLDRAVEALLGRVIGGRVQAFRLQRFKLLGLHDESFDRNRERRMTDGLLELLTQVPFH